jgi:hypothetical protein
MTDLISLDCYKEAKEISSTKRDGKTQQIITQVSALIEHYCNRIFTAYSTTPKVEWFDANNDTVFLTEFPVLGVSGVTTSENGGVTQVALTEADSNTAGYFVDVEDGAVYSQDGQPFLTTYTLPYRSLEVTYTAGYTEDTIPADLELCVIDTVDYYMDEQRTPSKSLLGGTIDNPQPYAANSFPPHIRRILDLYRYSP